MVGKISITGPQLKNLIRGQVVSLTVHNPGPNTEDYRVEAILEDVGFSNMRYYIEEAERERL